MELHPDLQRLHSVFLQLVESVDGGSMAVDEALSRVQELTATDGDGNIWRVSETSTPERVVFLRKRGPDDQFVEADPAQFAPAKVPGRDDMPFGGPVGQPPPAPTVAPPPAAPKPGRGPATLAEAEQLGGRHWARRWLSDGAVAWLRRHGVTVAVGSLAVAVVAAVVLTRGDDGPPPMPEDRGEEVEEVGEPVEPADPDDPPEGHAPDGGESEGGDPGPTPSPDDITRVVSALISGDPELAAEVVVAEQSEEGRWLDTALYAGFPAAGLDVRSAGPPAQQDEDGTAVSVVQVTTPGGDPLAEALLQWVVVDGRWVLAEWPRFGRVDPASP